jgi:hypothetical protein
VDPEVAAAQAQAAGPAAAQSLIAGAVLGFGGPLISGPAAGATALQNLIDAVGSGSPEGVAGAIINGPAVVADGFLNGGYGPNLAPITPYGAIPNVVVTAGGLFSPGAVVPGQITTIGLPGPIGTTISLIRTLQLLTNTPEVEEMSALNTSGGESAKTLNVTANPGAQQQGSGPAVIEEKKVTTDPTENQGNAVDVDKVTNAGTDKKDGPKLLGGNGVTKVGGGQGFKKLREGIEGGFTKALGDLDKTVKKFTGHGDDDGDGGNAASSNTGDTK